MRPHLVPIAAVLALAPIPACSGEHPLLGASSTSGGPPPIVPTVLDPPGPKDPDLAARAAVFIGSCIYTGYSTISVQNLLNEMYYNEHSSIKQFQSAMERTTGCFADKVNGCQAATECIGMTAEPPESCGATCPVATWCLGSVVYRFECDQLGQPCRNGTDCSTPRQPCEPGSVEPCQDGIPRYCPSDPPYLQQGFSCADYGLVCGIDPVNVPLCQGQGAACATPPQYLSLLLLPKYGCDGTSMHMCVNGFEHTLDCGILGVGFTCQLVNATSFCGIESTCDPVTDMPATCEGDTIVFCNAGRVEKIDCKALGFTGCDPTWGVCTPSPKSLF